MNILLKMCARKNKKTHTFDIFTSLHINYPDKTLHHSCYQYHLTTRIAIFALWNRSSKYSWNLWLSIQIESYLLIDEGVQPLQTCLAERVTAVEFPGESLSQVIRTVADDAIQFTAVPGVLCSSLHITLDRSLGHRPILIWDPTEWAQYDTNISLCLSEMFSADFCNG